MQETASRLRQPATITLRLSPPHVCSPGLLSTTSCSHTSRFAFEGHQELQNGGRCSNRAHLHCGRSEGPAAADIEASEAMQVSCDAQLRGVGQAPAAVQPKRLQPAAPGG